MKKTYLVEIRETLCRQIHVKATSPKEAHTIIKNRYNNEEIVLDENDFFDKEIEVLEEVKK